MNNQQITPEMVEQIISEMPDEQRKWFEGFTVDSLEEAVEHIQRLKDFQQRKENMEKEEGEIERFYESLGERMGSVPLDWEQSAVLKNVASQIRFSKSNKGRYYESFRLKSAFNEMMRLKDDLKEGVAELQNNINEMEQGYQFIQKRIEEMIQMENAGYENIQ